MSPRASDSASTLPRRRTLISWWFLPALGVALGMLAIVVAATLAASNPVGQIVGVIMIGATVLIGVGLVGESLLFLDDRGFRTLLRRRVPWASVGRISLREVPRFGAGTQALVVDHHVGADLHETTLLGFGRPGRPGPLRGLQQTMEQFRTAFGGPVEPVTPVSPASP